MIVLNRWASALPMQFSAAQVNAVCADYASKEQFHFGFYTRMELECWPIARVDAHPLACELTAVAVNMLRLDGPIAVNETDAWVPHSVKGGRIKTVGLVKAVRMIRRVTGGEFDVGVPIQVK